MMRDKIAPKCDSHPVTVARRVAAAGRCFTLAKRLPSFDIVVSSIESETVAFTKGVLIWTPRFPLPAVGRPAVPYPSAIFYDAKADHAVTCSVPAESLDRAAGVRPGFTADPLVCSFVRDVGACKRAPIILHMDKKKEEKKANSAHISLLRRCRN